MESYYWLIFMAVCIVIEIITLGLATLWFAIGALAAFIVAVCGGTIIAQTVVFLIVSLVTLFFTRPVAVRCFNGSRVKTNAESLIGETARVIERIDNINASGRVSVNGQEWMARTLDGAISEVGDVVTVESISGVKLIVKR